MRSYPASVLALAALALLPGWARAETVGCQRFLDPWTVAADDPRGGPPPGTIVTRDGVARAECVYRHRDRPDDIRRVAFVWVPAGTPPPADDPRLRCDSSAFVDRPGAALDRDRGMDVMPSHHNLAYVAVDPVRDGDDEHARMWAAMLWQGQIMLAILAAPRAVRCEREPPR